MKDKYMLLPDRGRVNKGQLYVATWDRTGLWRISICCYLIEDGLIKNKYMLLPETGQVYGG